MFLWQYRNTGDAQVLLYILLEGRLHSPALNYGDAMLNTNSLLTAGFPLRCDQSHVDGEAMYCIFLG